MSKRDYYDVLGVNRNAGEDEIKKVYRKLAMEHHPDRNPDNPKSEDRFKEAKEAYEILSDPNKRTAYDQQGHAGGDKLIKRVAEVLTAAFRAGDVVARLGGDEFAVLLPGANATTANNPALSLNLFESVKPAAGFGLRIKLDKYSRTNLAMDFAFGHHSSGFYLAVSETF